MISVNTSKDLANGFIPYKISSFLKLKNAILNYNWSPCLYKCNYRKNENFLSCSYCVLDFDEGPTIAEIKKRILGFAYVIAPTRSHQKPKGTKPPCDRFRLLLRFEKTIEDFTIYRRSISHYINLFNSDAACKDARFYYPSLSIDSFSAGKKIKVIETKSLDEEIKQLRSIRMKARFVSEKKLPSHINNFLKHGIVFGAGRNEACYVTAITLKELGFSKGDASSMIKEAPFSRTDFSESEIISAIAHVF